MPLPRCATWPTPREIAALRERHRLERERRIRPEGPGQYRSTDAEFGCFAADPYAGEVAKREPLHDVVDVAVIGGGFGGILAGARLRQQGVAKVRVVEKGGDFGGTWCWNRYPGIHCDIESHFYLPLDETGHVPRWKYVPGEEIRRHAVAARMAPRPTRTALSPSTNCCSAGARRRWARLSGPGAATSR